MGARQCRRLLSYVATGSLACPPAREETVHRRCVYEIPAQLAEIQRIQIDDQDRQARRKVRRSGLPGLPGVTGQLEPVVLETRVRQRIHRQIESPGSRKNNVLESANPRHIANGIIVRPSFPVSGDNYSGCS